MAASALAQGVLIDANTRNGSFESGDLSPRGSTGAAVAKDAGFASHGEWYATIGPLNWAIGQRLDLSSDSGLGFLLTFDARGSMDTRLSWVKLGTRIVGGPLTASVTPISVPALASTEWRTFKYGFEFPVGDWTDSVDLIIQFSGPGSGYLDNVLFQQIPEPSVLALVLIGAGLFLKRN